MEERLYTVKDLQEKLGITAKTVWSWLPREPDALVDGGARGPQRHAWTRETVLSVLEKKRAYYARRLEAINAMVDSVMSDF